MPTEGPGFSGDGGPATKAILAYPVAVAVDAAGNVFIHDSGSVREIDHASGIIRTIVNDPTLGRSCSLATGPCPANSLHTNLTGDGGIAVQGSTLWLTADIIDLPSSIIGAVLNVDLTTGMAQLVAGGGSGGGSNPAYPAVGATLQPNSITTDDGGNAFFTDDGDKVLVYSGATHTVTAIAGTGDRGLSGDGGPALAAMLIAPEGICLAPDHHVIFKDGDLVRSFLPGGRITTVAGNNSDNFFGDGGPATRAGLAGPEDVASDAKGNLYIADSDNLVVRRVDAVSGIITTLPTPSTANPALGFAPTGLAIDNANHLFVRSSNDILKIDLQTGQATTLVSGPYIRGPVVFDGDRTLYAVNLRREPAGQQVDAIDTVTGTVNPFAGANGQVPGFPNGDGGPANDASLGEVGGIAVDGKGHVYLSDAVYSNIRVITLSTGIIETFAGQFPLNLPLGDGGPALHAHLSRPSGLSYDGANHLIVADAGNQRIRQIDLTTGIINTIAGSGSVGFGGDGGAATNALMQLPQTAILDPTGNLFIADTINDRVRRVLLHPTKLTATLTSSAATANPGDSLTFTATYSGLSFGTAPTGTATFLSGSTSLGTASLPATPDSSGNYVATLSTSKAPNGTTTVTAQCSGDTHYAANSSSVAVMVGTAATPSYSLSATPASLSIKQGASGSITFSVTPLNGFKQAVAFSCDSTTLPTGTTCSFSPASVTPSGSTAVNSTFTVQTTGATTGALHTTPLPIWWVPGGSSALGLLLFSGSRSRRRVWRTWVCAAVFVVCFVEATGCGGNSSKGDSGSSPATANSTPTGTYSIKVSATAGTGPSAVAEPMTVSLTVTK